MHWLNCGFGWMKEIAMIDNPEDEAFNDIERMSSVRQEIVRSLNRKRQIQRIEQDFADIDNANNRKRNFALEEVAVELETKFTMPFGRDTVQSFASFVRGMKR